MKSVYHSEIYPLTLTAYEQFDCGSNKSLFYLSGHKNALDEHKALLVREICARQRVSLLNWAFWGWDESTVPDIPSGGEGYIRHWFSQTLDVFDRLTEGPQVLLGYSMGGCLALALAAARPERVAGIIGLAVGLGQQLCADATTQYGNFDLTDLSGQSTLPLRMKDDGVLVFDNPLPINCPVHLYHGMADKWVPYQNSFEIMKAISGTTVQTTLSKMGTHRLDAMSDKVWLEQQIRRSVAL